MRRYLVEYAGDYDFSDMEVYDVTDTKAAWPSDHTQVWHNPSRNHVSCCSCSGPLSAMLSTCCHANAVRRHLKASRPDTTETQ